MFDFDRLADISVVATTTFLQFSAARSTGMTTTTIACVRRGTSTSTGPSSSPLDMGVVATPLRCFVVVTVAIVDVSVFVLVSVMVIVVLCV